MVAVVDMAGALSELKPIKKAKRIDVRENWLGMREGQTIEVSHQYRKSRPQSQYLPLKKELMHYFPGFGGASMAISCLWLANESNTPLPHNPFS